MKKMCRLHFTFCIFCVCVRILVFVTPKWKIYSMGWVVLGLRWENDMIFYGSLDPDQFAYLNSEFWGTGHS